MSKIEILQELPKLTAEDRRELFERLCKLQDEDIIHGIGPSEEEKKILDAALEEYTRNGDTGRPWREVLRELGLPTSPESI